MSTSTLDPDFVGGSDRQLGTGHDNDALGPSDSSDSGSDVCGLTPAGIDTDSQGTGERASVNPDIRGSNRDINVDHMAQFDDIVEDDDVDARTSDYAADKQNDSTPQTLDSEADEGKLGLEADDEGDAEDQDQNQESDD